MKNLQLANGQDYATVNGNFVSSLVNVSSTQYQRCLSYITEYTTATAKLSQASGYLFATLQNVVNIANVQSFLSSIQDHLNANVQKLFLKYSPANVRNFIVQYYQTFLSNLSVNNGTQAEILSMNLLFLNNILKPNASACMSKYNANRYQIYLDAASNFTKLMEDNTSSTATQLDALRKEINDMVKSIVKSVEKIISNRETAREQFDNFVSILVGKKRHFNYTEF